MASNNGDEKTFVVPSLLKSAYYACDATERKKFNEMPVMSVDLKMCCESLFLIMKMNSNVELFQPLGNRRLMFPKVYPIICSPSNDFYLLKNICEIAAFFGHIDCMKLARAIGVPWYSPATMYKSACDRAAESGYLECLKYAHVNGSPWHTLTSSVAARNGHLECLVYLHDNGCPWDEISCIEASTNGHLECLKYCRQNGCPWNIMTCISAATTGKLDCLKYAMENGCPWDASVCSAAADYGQFECLQYAFEKGCEWNIGEFFASPRITSLISMGYSFSIRRRQEDQNERADEVIPYRNPNN